MNDWGYCTDCDASVETHTRLILDRAGEVEVSYCNRCGAEINRSRVSERVGDRS